MERGEKFGISGSSLKILAMLCMLIDHAGLDLFDNCLAMRAIGRVSFPIYIFLFVEGFQHTRNRAQYALRLGFFALLSEIPFNLMVTGTIWDREGHLQNVLFTFLIGFFVLCLQERLNQIILQSMNWMVAFSQAYLVAIGMILLAVLAAWGRTDYGAIGVIAISVAYHYRYNKWLEILGICVVLCCMGWIEPFCLLAVLPVMLYNGERGLRIKYAFYVFYPMHMLVLGVIRLIMIR